MESEIVRLVGFIDRMYKLFGLSYHVELSTRPEDKFIGEIETWNRAEQILQDALKKAGKDFVLNQGDGAFYGPKLDFKVKDSLGREWQCGTIQLDMQLPERFDLTYIDADGSKKRPVMLHRVIYGSIERFIGILIEHFAGCFPLWMAPVQVNVIPVKNEYHLEYAEKVVKLLEEKGLRVKLDAREEKLGYRMREAQTKKYNYNLILGNAERDENKISFRKHGSEETVSMEINEFVEMLEKEIANKEINK